MIEILRNRDSLSSCRDEELADSLSSCRDEEKKDQIRRIFSSLIRSGLRNESENNEASSRSDLGVELQVSVLPLLRPLLISDEKKRSNTKNIFVFVCYKDRENRKLRRRFRFFVILVFFSSLIRSGLSNGSTDTCNSTPRSDLELASLFSLSFLSCYCTKKRRFSEHFNLQETSLYKRYCKT